MRDAAKPKYAEIKDAVLKKILDNSFGVGEKLPSEHELIEMFGVSRTTVREALSELEYEGYLYKVQGKGTFVKEQQRKQNLFSLTSCTHDIIRLGMTPSRDVIFSGIVTADSKRRQLLNLKENEQLFSLKRVYRADNVPINYTQTYLPYKYVDGIEHFDFSQASLYDVLENKYAIKISKAVRTVTAVIADGETSKFLEIEKGVPLLLFRCTTYGKIRGREFPVETFKCYYRSDKFDFFIDQVR